MSLKETTIPSPSPSSSSHPGTICHTWRYERNKMKWNEKKWKNNNNKWNMNKNWNRNRNQSNLLSAVLACWTLMNSDNSFSMTVLQQQLYFSFFLVFYFLLLFFSRNILNVMITKTKGSWSIKLYVSNKSLIQPYMGLSTNEVAN